MLIEIKSQISRKIILKIYMKRKRRKHKKSVLITMLMINLWKVSMDIFLGFVIFSIICSLAFVRVDRKHAVILIVTAVMFYLKLEYLLPVLLGMIVGFGAILPAAAGVVVYFLSVYMTDVSTLLTTSSSSSFGMGLQRIVNLMLIDKKLLVFLITFSLIIFITTLLCHLFYERAWKIDF